jgi:hypothetical protein
MGKLLRNCTAMRIAYDATVIVTSLFQDHVQIGRECRHVVRPGEIAASAVATQIGNKHPESASEEFDERIKHAATNHQPVQQKQRLAFAFDAVEDPLDAQHSFGLPDIDISNRLSSKRVPIAI